ncbi:hypothetical protein, partial [Pontiella sp.]|uniref:hypothetical protein n=1 Tax=Pontiella sp. TaxID=2837462 RepID=UPI00356948C8
IDLPTLEVSATYDSPGHAYGLARDGAALYLADGVSGLRVLDAATLAPTGSWVTNGPAMDIVVDGSSLYLLDHFNGVVALDAALNVTGGYDQVAFGNRMESDGTVLYVVDGLGNLTQVDRATMTVNTNAPAIPTFGLASGRALDGGKLYAAEGFGGLSIYDATTETLLGNYSAVARSRASAIAEGCAYLAAGSDGVKIFDLADPANPTLLASVACSNALDVAVCGNLLLVADAFEGLVAFDLTSPAAPLRQGAYAPTPPGVVRRVGAAGSTAYIAEGYTVHRMDLSNPAAPTVAESFASADYVFDLDVAGTNAILATGTDSSVTVDGTQGLVDWELTDLSDPLTPIAVTNFGALVRAMQLTLAGNVVYASADDGGTAVLLLPSITNDSDGDGFDDAFEQLIIDFDAGDAFATLDDVDPDDDFDGDGLSNLHEQIAGTSPTDPQSVFAIRGIDGEAGGPAVSWYSEAGRSYTVHRSTNLVVGFHILTNGVPATAPINTHVDADALDCAMYMITID